MNASLKPGFGEPGLLGSYFDSLADHRICPTVAMEKPPLGWSRDLPRVTGDFGLGIPAAIALDLVLGAIQYYGDWFGLQLPQAVGPFTQVPGATLAYHQPNVWLIAMHSAQEPIIIGFYVLRQHELVSLDEVSAVAYPTQALADLLLHS